MDHKDAYICYNRADSAWVKHLATQIESETIDGSRSGRYLQVFFDEWDIDAGQSLIDRMNAGLESARHVITVLSPEFLKADWPRFEWKHIVADDPNNSREKLIPVLLRDTSIDGTERLNFPAPFRDLKYLDFRKQSDFRQTFAELIRRIRNLPHERGRRLTPLTAILPVAPVAKRSEASWQADRVSDLLLSNLLPVVSLPGTIFGALTQLRKKQAVWEKIGHAPPFVLREGRIFTFADLSSEHCPFRDVIDVGTIEPESRADWLIEDNRCRWLMELLNASLNAHLRKIGIRQDGKGRYYFLPEENNGDRCWTVKGGRTRIVTSKKVNVATGSTFWVHLSARMRFKRIGARLFLCVEPAFLFTSDGRASVGGKSAGKLSLLWGGRQQNPDILRNFLFWAGVMAMGRPSIELQTGGEPVKIARESASARLDFGIAGDEIRIRALLTQGDSDLEKAAAEFDLADSNEDDDTDEELDDE